MLQTSLKTLVTLFVYLVLADVLGVIVCLVTDIAPLRYDSGLLPYAIWLVIGVFTGLFAFSTAGNWASPEHGEQWMERPGAVRTGNIVFGTALLMAVAICVCLDRIQWSRGFAGEYFVPDSAPHTIVFLAATMGGMWLGRAMCSPLPRPWEGRQ